MDEVEGVFAAKQDKKLHPVGGCVGNEREEKPDEQTHEQLLFPLYGQGKP